MNRLPAPLLLSLLTLLIAASFAKADTERSDKPNIILIFVDDLGYGDIGCFGSTQHRTPNIDRMAEEGMKLTSFYVTSGVCTPSRSSLMTGCYPRRVNMHQSERGQWVLFPGNARGLNPEEVTIAEVLGDAGYATAIVGKWHLGDQPVFLPTRQGFDSYFGIPFSNDMGHGHNRRYPPLPLLRNEELIETEPDQRLITRRYTEEALAFIEENKDEPFFLYLPHSMPHNPVFSSEGFAGESANGGYGDCVEEIDWSTGEILKALKEYEIDDNTLVIFTSDNGAASRWGGSNAPLSGFKGSTMEGGMRVCCVARWPGQVPVGSTCDELASTIDLLPTFAQLAGTGLPADRVIDGITILPLLRGEENATTPHECFYYYFTNQLQAVRSGQWKLHLTRSDQPARLYDLSQDIAEENNVVEDHPDVVAQLEQFAEQAREELGDGDHAGTGQRPAGAVENPVTLTPRVRRE